ncbi:MULTISPECIES: class I SAM-dependent methyltransferase [Sphingomonas]|jgi:predicted methyltransferase|uniref:Methyltransferase n=1 Tax=Sphingomonas hankookensis TaxID=563996 RepID=A0ABR5YA75_9SPHN|nr:MULTISPECIES: methyltransferase domain-containing protein [Sphingomonas]KZE11527.1 methyltransferase [Sphingomonas hankookensis]PZT94084.1 MAG: methyltransferase domain-containing protein [Sphingomonas sp.]RSV30829.1 methyltransferase domain-containing protein [Sphingomonas sp. ABOLH]WCP72264.1 methyltransferase domain-containing protein [Sphingomonas hankookensis]
MRRTALFLPVLSAALVALTPAPAQAPRRPLAAAVGSPLRSPANVARDRYRHPVETLTFFGVKPTDTVVEIWPGNGWYSEILAPMLREKGRYVAAGPLPRTSDMLTKLQARDATAFGKAQAVAFPAEAGQAGVPDGVADKVLTFRNVHNWRFGGADRAQAAFDAMFRMLKPGGVLGVVEHRLPEARDAAAEEKSGYMKESSVIAFATKAGFKLAARSNVNANPKDTADWPQGVWTLPPTYRLKDVDRAKYAAIGESDRMTLRFLKPK